VIDELEWLKQRRPEVPPPTEAALQAGRQALERSIARERSVPARRRVWLIRAGMVAAACVAVAVLIGFVGAGSPTEPPSAAAAELNRLALVAEFAPSPVLRPGQYYYVESEDSYEAIYSNRFAVMAPVHREAWFGRDLSGWLRETQGKAYFPTAQDRGGWIAAGRPALGSPGTSDTAFGPGCWGMLNLTALPTDPVTLRADLVARRIEGGPPGSGEDFIQIGDLLRENYAPAKLRSAVYKVAATIPGVQLLGTIRDHAGRTGIGLAKIDRGIRYELIFDPRTSALLGEQQTIATRGSGFNGPVGTVTGWAVYLRSAIVDSLPRSRPAFRAVPIPARKGNTPRLLPGVTGLAPGGCRMVKP
jgi:hypothetical protein